MFTTSLHSMMISPACVLAISLTGAAASSALAQHEAPTARLTVRPHDMATGTETKEAGLQHIPGIADQKYMIYVPKQCVGKARVPLVVYLHGGGRDSQSVLDEEQAFADQYGMILLLPNATEPGRWDVIYDGMADRDQVWKQTDTGEIDAHPQHDVDIRKVDKAMKYVLAHYAIDPDKIAIAGFSDGGSYSMFLGRNNLDIFSRVMGLSALIPFTGHGPKHEQTKFILSGGFAENMLEPVLKRTRQLRKEGHEVEPVLAIRRHWIYAPDDAYAWSWLANSWAAPGKAKPETKVTPDSADPELTMDELTKLMSFWHLLLEEPDNVSKEGRWAHQQHIRVIVGDMPVSIIMMNTPEMAATFPAVAADLKTAGLTAEEADNIRRAFTRAIFTRKGGEAAGKVASGSMLEKNMAFVKTHVDEINQKLKELNATNMLIAQ